MYSDFKTRSEIIENKSEKGLYIKIPDIDICADETFSFFCFVHYECLSTRNSISEKIKNIFDTWKFHTDHFQNEHKQAERI